MVQINLFDSFLWNLLIFLLKQEKFLIKRITELFGLIIDLFIFTLLISILSYSPNDPNFLIKKTEKINNLLGYDGSVVSDFLFQSFGLITYLIPLTLFFSGTNIFIKKNLIIIIDNLFFSIIYIIFGTLFFSFFKDQSFF